MSTCRGRRSIPAWGSSAIAAVLQGKHDNYAIDLFATLIQRHCRLDQGVNPDGPQKASHRVIADHLRASAFLIADGVLPSNEGRGYVLRRIMRRAMRHAELLGAKDPLMWKLVPMLTREMGQAYPELLRAEALDHRDAQAGGDALPPHARARPRHPRREEQRPEERCNVRRRHRLYALRHLRLSARSDAGRAARARHFSVDLAELRRRHAAPARESARVMGRLRRGRAGNGLVFVAREDRRDRISRLRDRKRRRRRRGSW